MISTLACKTCNHPPNQPISISFLKHGPLSVTYWLPHCGSDIKSIKDYCSLSVSFLGFGQGWRCKELAGTEKGVAEKFDIQQEQEKIKAPKQIEFPVKLDWLTTTPVPRLYHCRGPWKREPTGILWAYSSSASAWIAWRGRRREGWWSRRREWSCARPTGGRSGRRRPPPPPQQPSASPSLWRWPSWVLHRPKPCKPRPNSGHGLSMSFLRFFFKIREGKRKKSKQDTTPTPPAGTDGFADEREQWCFGLAPLVERDRHKNDPIFCCPFPTWHLRADISTLTKSRNPNAVAINKEWQTGPTTTRLLYSLTLSSALIYIKSDINPIQKLKFVN